MSRRLAQCESKRFSWDWKDGSNWAWRQNVRWWSKSNFLGYHKITPTRVGTTVYGNFSHINSCFWSFTVYLPKTLQPHRSCLRVYRYLLPFLCIWQRILWYLLRQIIISPVSFSMAGLHCSKTPGVSYIVKE